MMIFKNLNIVRIIKIAVGTILLISHVTYAKEAVMTNQGTRLEEIIVTANKREQVLQDSAMAISVLSGDTIEKRGLMGMDDYLRTLPSVNMQDRGAGQNSIIIRGIGADPQVEDSMVGVYLGEIPLAGLGGSATNGRGGNADIKLVDVERIEVLRGPQGTLYGSGSMGGTVRVIPVSPNLTEVEGKIATRYSQTGDRGGDNSMVQAVLNVPLIEDTLAIRGVAYRFDNSGYIDNVAATQPSTAITDAIASGGFARDYDEAGSDEYTGFRLAALWQPMESLDITLTYIQQEIEQNGQPETDLNLSEGYQQRRLNVGVGGTERESLKNDIDVTNLVINYDLGWGTASSSSSWVDYQSKSASDVLDTIAVLSLNPGFGPAFPMGTAAPYYNLGSNERDHFTQELRLASKLDGRFQFIAGLYYEDNERNALQTWAWSGDTALNPLPGLNFFNVPDAETVEQQAIFGELSYELSEDFTATLGARYFDYDRATRGGFSAFAASAELPPADTISETDSTYKVNLSYTPSDDLLLYGQWAEGFRLGQGIPDLSALCDPDGNGVIDEFGAPQPRQVDSDTSESYELGVKATLPDKRTTLNASIYRINWDGVPVLATPMPSCSFLVNAGKATSEGVELEIQTALTDSLQLNASASYGEAVLRNTNSLGNKGDNLPGSADFNMSLGLEYGFELAQNPSFVRIDYSYLSEYFSNTAEDRVDPTAQASGGFGQLNLKAGMTINQFDIDIFINNATNVDEFTWTETVFTTVGARRAYQVRPRTVGLNFGYRF